jgi:hypothetical protein
MNYGQPWTIGSQPVGDYRSPAHWQSARTSSGVRDEGERHFVDAGLNVYTELLSVPEGEPVAITVNANGRVNLNESL